MKPLRLTFMLVISFMAFKTSNLGLEHSRMPAGEESRVFTYEFQGEPLKLTLKGMNWIKAHSLATTKCMDYYTKGNVDAFIDRVSDDEYLALVDVCANPKEK